MLRGTHALSKWHCALLALAASVCVASCSREKTSEIWIGDDVHVGENGDGLLDPLLPLFGDAPLIANLEGPATTLALTTSGQLSNAPSAVDAIAPPLIAVGVANNHTFDFGLEEVFTAQYALAKVGVYGVGSHPFVPKGSPWVIVAHDVPPGPRMPTLDPSLRKARARGGVMIVMLHSSGPELYLPPPEIRDAVDLAVLAGADVIAVHGSHVVGPVERRGKTVIAWGLGNLLFRCECTKQNEGLLLRLVKRGNEPIEAEVVPIEAGLGGAPARLAPSPETQLDLIDALSPVPLVRSSLRDARTGRLPAHQAPEYQR